MTNHNKILAMVIAALIGGAIGLSLTNHITKAVNDFMEWLHIIISNIDTEKAILILMIIVLMKVLVSNTKTSSPKKRRKKATHHDMMRAVIARDKKNGVPIPKRRVV